MKPLDFSHGESSHIIYTGIQLIRETTSSILGERADKELVQAIRADLSEYKQIIGSYDFIVHNYGPTVRIGTANLEFADTMSIKEVYTVMDAAQKKIKQNHQVYFTFGLYSVNTYDEDIKEINENVGCILLSTPHVLGYHAFYADTKDKEIRFDVVVDFEVKDFATLLSLLTEKINNLYSDYAVKINVDLDYA